MWVQVRWPTLCNWPRTFLGLALKMPIPQKIAHFLRSQLVTLSTGHHNLSAQMLTAGFQLESASTNGPDLLAKMNWRNWNGLSLENMPMPGVNFKWRLLGRTNKFNIVLDHKAPTPVLLPGKSHGQRSLVGCCPWGRWESDTTERLHFHFSLSCIEKGNVSPLQCSCLENPRDGGAWWAAV